MNYSFELDNDLSMVVIRIEQDGQRSEYTFPFEVIIAMFPHIYDYIIYLHAKRKNTPIERKFFRNVF